MRLFSHSRRVRAVSSWAPPQFLPTQTEGGRSKCEMSHRNLKSRNGWIYSKVIRDKIPAKGGTSFSFLFLFTPKRAGAVSRGGVWWHYDSENVLFKKSYIVILLRALYRMPAGKGVGELRSFPFIFPPSVYFNLLYDCAVQTQRVFILRTLGLKWLVL